MSDLLQERRPLGALAGRRTAEPDTELLSPATQVVGDTDAYLGNTASDIGRRIADDQLELFVVCHPAEAMLQLLSQHATDYIAIHDIGTASSARLLAAVATAASQKQQKLVIRRQGYGVALATLQFVELQLQPGRKLRIYGTQIDGDMQTRRQLAQVMLAHSRLAVVMLGELPAHALDSSLQPLRDAIAAGPWPNRQMLLVPLAPAATLPAQAAALAGRSGVIVRTTPQANRLTDAWSYISGAWNRLNSGVAEAPVARSAPPTQVQGAAPAPTAYVRTRPLEPNPMPHTGAQPAPPLGTADTAPWSDYVKRCAEIEGVVECCIFDIDRQRSLAHSGSQRMADRLAAKGAMLHALMCDSADVLGLGPAEPEATIGLSRHCLLLRPMPGRPHVALHLLFERGSGDIEQVRAQLKRIDLALLGNAGR